MACGSGQDHSTFESVTNQLFTHRSSFPENPGMQVVFSDEKQVNFQKTELEVVVQDQDSPEYPANSDAQCNLPPQPRRKWLLYGGVAAILIVVAAVLGGVLGWRANKKSPSESFSTLSSSTSSNVPSPFPSFNAITTIQSQRKLAAVSYAVNSVDNTRVYYQDNAGEIVEAASSAKSSTWINIKLGFFAKNGSAIGAAVSRPGFTHEIILLYVDSTNLIHNVIYNSKTDRWIEGDLSRQKLITSSNASLSALYWQCVRCTNTTIIAYQDVNGFVQIGNRTSAGWVFTQINLNPIQLIHPAYIGGVSDQINFYYQKSNLNLSQACWIPALDDKSVSSWVPDTSIHNVAPPGTPIAAISSYSIVSSGYDTWIEILSLSATGIKVDSWSGLVGSLVQDSHPLPMTNSTANPKIYGALAVTAIGRAFAVVSTSDQKYAIESWQVADDFVSWTSTGTVNIGNAWD